MYEGGDNMINSNDSFKQITDTIRSLNKIGANIVGTTGITQMIADSIQIHNDRFREITDTIRGINRINTSTVASITSAFKIYNEQIANAIRLFDIAGVQLAASTSALQKLVQENYSQMDTMLHMVNSAMAINVPAINIFKKYHDELTRTLNIIPQTVFANIDFDKIHIQSFKDLALELNDLSLESWGRFY